MILTGPEIEARMASGEIVIDPPPAKVGPNSVDLHLGDWLRVYERPCWIGRQLMRMIGRPWHLDPNRPNPTRTVLIPPEGLVIHPGELYLAYTIEMTHSPLFVPRFDGRSSVGRLGVRTHQTAGFGDVGFCGQWTLEIDCVIPVRLYPGMRIGQVSFSEVTGEVRGYQGRYQHQMGPTASRFWEGDK